MMMVWHGGGHDRDDIGSSRDSAGACNGHDSGDDGVADGFFFFSLSLSFLSSLALCSLAGGPAGRIPVPWTMAAAGRSAAEVAEAAAGHVYLGDLEDVHSVASSTALPTNAVSEIPVLFLDSAIAFPGQVCR